MSDLKVGMRVIANTGGLGLPYRARIEHIMNGKALLKPLHHTFTASSIRTGKHTKRSRWVLLDRLIPEIKDSALTTP
jgi:hypothetical protein